MTNTKVSVIIPIYNAADYLRECLDSVLSQTLQDIEVICVDDGSTDDCLEILREYEAADERIKLVEQENKGAAAARNAGMLKAVGEYLAFLDADDLYYPKALEAAYKRAVAVNADMLLFEADFFDAVQGVLRTETVEDKWLGGLPEFAALIVPRFIFQVASCNTWNKLYRREFVIGLGLKYQEIQTANDLCFVYSAIARAEKVAVLKQPLIQHRVLRSGNLQSGKSKTPWDFFEALLQLKRNLQRFGLWGNLRQSYLNAALFHCRFNWQTVNAEARERLMAGRRNIQELLELGKHSEGYYYSREDYELICRVVGFRENGDERFMAKIKDWLKRILPPPVNAFNREVAGLKQYMLELNAGLEARQRQNEAVLKMQQSKLAEIEKQNRKIQEMLLVLDKLARDDSIQQRLEETRKEIVSIQSEQILGIGEKIESGIGQGCDWADKIQAKLLQLKAQNEEACDLVRHNEQKIMENNSQISETIWAQIFNDTIIDSKWLTNRTFSPGRWAVGYPYLYAMYRVLNEARPKRILELGLGQSTRMIGQYAAAFADVEHIVVEHDPEWIDFFEKDFQLTGNSRIVQLEREMIAYKEAEKVRVFKGFEEQFSGQKFDFISIDAPLGGDMKQYARIDVLKMLPDCLSDNFVIMIDDCERIGETNTLAEMKKAIEEYSIKYKIGRYRGQKDCVLICAAHMGFLASM